MSATEPTQAPILLLSESGELADHMRSAAGPLVVYTRLEDLLAALNADGRAFVVVLEAKPGLAEPNRMKAFREVPDPGLPLVLVVESDPSQERLEAWLHAGADDVIQDPDARTLRMRLTVARKRLRQLKKLHRARLAMQESEQRARRRHEELEHYYKTLPVGLCLLDRELRFVRVNGRMADLNGTSVSAHVGKRLKDMAPHLSRQAQKALLEVFETGEPYFDLEIRTRKTDDASDLVLLASFFPLQDQTGRDEAGAITGVSAVFHDITDRWLAEDALRRSEERLRNLLENVPSHILAYDRNGRITYINHTAPGFTAQQVIGQPAELFVQADERERFRKVLAQTFRTGEPADCELHDVNGRDYLSRYVALKNGSQVESVLCVATDITEVKRARASLEESEAKFRTVCDFAPIMINVFNEAGRCLVWNHECEKQLGYTAEEVRAHPDPMAIFFQDSEAREKVKDHIRRADGMFRIFRVVARNGEEHTQLWANFLLPNGHLIGAGLDVTDGGLVREITRFQEAV